MATTFDSSAFDRGTDGVMRFFTTDQARAIVEYHGDETIQARIEQLASRNTEGDLTAEELAEFEGYVKANKFIAVLQAKARKLLAS